MSVYNTAAYASTTIVIRELNDFPAPIAGVINLVSGVEYIITGVVNIGTNTIKINARNSLFGFTRGFDGIVSTTTGTLFDVTNANFVMTNLVISVPNGTIINVNNNTGNFGASINTCILSGNILGTIGGTSTQNFAFRSNTISNTFAGGGFTFTGASNGLCAIQDNITTNSGGILLNYGTSIWQQIVISNNSFTANSGQTILSGAVNSANVAVSANLSSNQFTGLGTYNTGIIKSDLKWLFVSNSPNVQNSETIGELYMIGNTVPTTFTGAGVYTKVLGTTTAGENERFTMSTDNRLTYIGLETANLFISASLSMSKSTSTAQDLRAVLYLDGTSPITSTTASVNIKNNADLVSATVQGFISLNTNQFVELWIENLTSKTNITVNTMNFSIT